MNYVNANKVPMIKNTARKYANDHSAGALRRLPLSGCYVLILYFIIVIIVVLIVIGFTYI